MKHYIDERLLSKQNNPKRTPTISDIAGVEARASNSAYQTVELDTTIEGSEEFSAILSNTFNGVLFGPLYLDGTGGNKEITIPVGGSVAGTATLYSIATTGTATVTIGSKSLHQINFMVRYESDLAKQVYSYELNNITSDPDFLITVFGQVQDGGTLRFFADSSSNDGADFYSILRITGMKLG